MTTTTLGDLSTHFMLRRQNVLLRTEAQRLGNELASGETSNPSRHLGGDLAALSDIETRMVANSAFRQATAEAMTITDAMQTVLGNFQDITQDLGDSLLTAADSGLNETGAVAGNEARMAFNQAVAALNTRVAGRSLFSGQDVSASALASADAMLTSLRSAVSGWTSTGDILNAVDAWFDTPGGGFDVLGYTGSGNSIPAFRVADGVELSLDLRADRSALRDGLKAIALAALAGDPVVGLDHDSRREIYREAATGLLAAQDAITGLRADIGATQARLEETSVRHASERLGLEQARSGLLSVDPYETATRLEQVQFNLESLYTVTVRLSRMSLAEYM